MKDLSTHFRMLVFVMAAALAVGGVYWALEAPYFGVLALVIASWPLIIAWATTRAGGCLVYPLMILPAWLVMIVAAFSLALEGEYGNQAERASAQTLYFSYFFFVHTSMILALYHRFTRADDRALVSTGERVTLTMFALAPLILIGGAYLYTVVSVWLRLSS